MAEPSWTYDLSTDALVGPHPRPPLPAVTLSAESLGAKPEHTVAEIDQELGVAALGTGNVAQPWEKEYFEHSFCLPGWLSNGWYLRYRRSDAESFRLTHVWAENWNVTTWRNWNKQ